MVFEYPVFRQNLSVVYGVTFQYDGLYYIVSNWIRIQSGECADKRICVISVIGYTTGFHPVIAEFDSLIPHQTMGYSSRGKTRHSKRLNGGSIPSWPASFKKFYALLVKRHNTCFVIRYRRFDSVKGHQIPQ